jgi:hypothetical protein
MKERLKISEKIEISNITMTLVISIITLIISYNSYKISINTYNNSESINKLNDKQSELELKNSILELMNISGMLRQSEKNSPNIENCLKAFNEMKPRLESQLKNSRLSKYPKLADMWTDLLGDISFNIKLFEPGLRPTVTISQAYEKIVDLEKKCRDIFQEFANNTLSTK